MYSPCLKVDVLTNAAADFLRACRNVSLLAVGALTLFSWLSPNHYYPWTTFHAQLASSAAAALLSMIVLASWSEFPSRAPYLALVAAAASVIPWIQFHAGIIYFYGDALLACVYLLAFALMQVIGFHIAAQQGLRKLLEPLSWLLLAGSLLSTWIALYQWQGLDYLFVFALELSRGDRPFANFAQPNQLATLLVLGIVGCAYLYHLRRLSAIAATPVAALFAFGIAMTASRAAMLELLCIGVVLLVTLRGQRTRVNLRAIAFVAALVASSMSLWPYMQQVEQAGVRNLASATSAGTRPTHWLSMLDAARRQPWAGYGWNQTSVAHFSIAAEYPATYETLGESHNLILDLLVWNGLVLGTLISAAVVAWFVMMMRRRHSPESALALAMVIAVFAHSMVEFPIYYLYFMLPIALLMGALVAELQPAASMRVPAGLIPLSFASLTAVGAALSLEYLRIEEEVRLVRFEAARIVTGRARWAADEVRLLTHHAAFIQFARTPPRVEMSAAELVWMGQIARRYPHSTVILRYASALALNDQPAAATDALRLICHIRPELECEHAQQQWQLQRGASERIAALPFPAAPKP